MLLSLPRSTPGTLSFLPKRQLSGIRWVIYFKFSTFCLTTMLAEHLDGLNVAKAVVSSPSAAKSLGVP